MTPELFIAILSLATLVNKKPFQVLKRDISKGLKLQDEIRRQIGLILQNKPLPKLEPLVFKDMEDLRSRLENFNGEQVMQEILPELGRQGIDPEVGSAWMNLITSLHTMLPADTIIDSGFKIDSAPASSISLQIKFLWAARIAEDPLWVLHLFQKMQLSDFDIQMIQQFYPDLYTFMSEAFITEIIENFKITDSLPRRLKLMLSIFLQTPVLNAETIAAYQAGNQESQSNESIKPVDLQVSEGEEK